MRGGDAMFPCFNVLVMGVCSNKAMAHTRIHYYYITIITVCDILY